MEDILIHARRNTCTLVGQTAAGKKWMVDNYRSVVKNIPIEVLEDFKKDLTELKLTYEDL